MQQGRGLQQMVGMEFGGGLMVGRCLRGRWQLGRFSAGQRMTSGLKEWRTLLMTGVERCLSCQLPVGLVLKGVAEV